MTNILLIVFIVCTSTTLYSQETSPIKWTAFKQVLEIPSSNFQQFKISAYVKTKLDERAGWAGIWVRLENKKEEVLFFNNMYQQPIRKKTWDVYTIKGDVEKEMKKIIFGGICMGRGNFYFDNFVIEFQDKKGNWVPLPVKNPEFELSPVNKEAPYWLSKPDEKTKQIPSTCYSYGLDSITPYAGKYVMEVRYVEE